MGGGSSVEYKLTFDDTADNLFVEVNGVSVSSGYVLKNADVISASSGVGLLINGTVYGGDSATVNISDTDINIELSRRAPSASVTINFSIT